MLRSHLVLTAIGPVLTVTSYGRIDHPELRALLERKSIDKYIAFELDLETVRRAYAETFDTMTEGLTEETPEVRVLEIDGHDIFRRIPFSDLRDPVICEP